MKFRVSKEDLIIFIIFCVLLLYLCAIGVMNFVTFGAEGHLWGLNPFPAFGPKYITITLVLFFAALIMIFTSVSSYIFSREKGPGIGITIGEKEEKGYNRWAKDKEIKQDFGVEQVLSDSKNIEHAGVVLACKDNKLWVDDGEYHTLVIGSSGSGKSRCVVKPLVNVLAKHGESMIVTDPKGELYEASAKRLKDLGYNVLILNFRNPSRGSAWNPLTLPYQYYKEGNKDKAVELLNDVALNILYDPANKNDPFWEKSASDYFAGLALSLFENANENEININSISAMSTEGDERFGTTHYINEYFNLMGKRSTAYTFAANTINAPGETQGGILSTFRQKIRMFATQENLSEMLGHSDFNMRDIGNGKTAIFLVIHDEKTTYHSLATIFIKQCYETLIDVAQGNHGKLPIRTNIILDEFANMPPLKDVDSMVTAARSRLIRFTFIIQNFAQLNDVYGKEVAEVIRGNCGNTIYLISTELAALEEISKMCGEVKSGKDDKTASTPLVTITDLQHMKKFEGIILRLRKHPFKTKLPLNDKINWGYELEMADYPTRELKPIEIFDIKEFVQEKKRQKILDDANKEEINIVNNQNPMPSMPNPFNPFSAAPGQVPNMNFNNIDIDKMIQDIDKRIAELDEEEKKNNNQSVKPSPSPVPPVNSVPNLSENQNVDINKLIGDIDKRIAELDEEERKEKEAKNQSNNDAGVNININNVLNDVTPVNKEVIVPSVEVKNEEVIVPDNHNNIIQTEQHLDKPVTKEVITPSIEVKNEEVIVPDNHNNIIKTEQYLDKPVTKEVITPSIEVVKEEQKVVGQVPAKEEVLEPQVNNTNNEHAKFFNTGFELPSVSNMHHETNKDDRVLEDIRIIEDIPKPKINVDADSIVVNDSVVSDDEFFDDFFGDEDE